MLCHKRVSDGHIGGLVKHAGTLKRYLACTMAQLTSLSDPLTDTESLLPFIEAVTNIFQNFCANFLSVCLMKNKPEIKLNNSKNFVVQVLFATKYTIVLRNVQVFCARSLF